MEDRRPAVIIVPMVMAAIAVIAVVLRLAARRIKRTSLGADDYTIIAALIFCLGLCATITIGGVSGNFGKHTIGPNGKPIHVHDKAHALKQGIIRTQTLWVTQWMAALGEGLTKISILLFYRRIFLGKVFLVSTWVVAGLCGIWTVSFFFANLFACPHVTTYWQRPQPAACVDIIQMLWAQNISDVLTDVMILVLPWHPTYHLQMPLRQRLTVCAIFLLGGFVVAAGIARVVFLSQGLHSGPDRSYDQAPAFYWGAIQACVGIVSACLPTLRPLLQTKLLHTFFSGLRSRFSSSGSKTKLADQGSPRPKHRNSDEKSETSLVNSTWAGQHRGYDRYDTSVEAVQMHTFAHPGDSIMVQSSFTHDHGIV